MKGVWIPLGERNGGAYVSEIAGEDDSGSVYPSESPECSGAEILNACVKATAIAAAVGKRAFGSLAILLRITSERAGEMPVLISSGGFGRARRCCIIISNGLSAVKGVSP